MYYLSAFNRDLFIKVTIAMFSFYHLKYPSNIMKDIFVPSIYILEKKFLVKRKINLYSLTSWKMTKLFLQTFVIFNMITEYFLKEKWGTCKEVLLQKLIKSRLPRQYSFWHFSSCLKMKNYLENVFLPIFFKNILTETSYVCFKNF